MLRKLGLLFAALALFSIAGGHWAVLQTFAWAEMLHDYAQRSGSVTMAIEQTFDGQHPCELCRQIADAKAKERRESPGVPQLKEDAKVKALVADTQPDSVPRVVTEISLPRVAAEFYPDRSERPPIPPPRRGTFAA